MRRIKMERIVLVEIRQIVEKIRAKTGSLVDAIKTIRLNCQVSVEMRAPPRPGHRQVRMRVSFYVVCLSMGIGL